MIKFKLLFIAAMLQFDITWEDLIMDIYKLYGLQYN